MKVLIVSDTHGKDERLEKLMQDMKPEDLIIHLGDLQGSEGSIASLSPCPVEMVCGNNDFFSRLEREKVIEVGKYRIFMTHGHYYYVGYGTERLEEAAAKLDCNIVMYGHTHRPVIDTEGPIWVINPGSLSYPRQENKRPSYVIMDMENPENAAFSLHYL